MCCREREAAGRGSRPAEHDEKAAEATVPGNAAAGPDAAAAETTSN